MLGNCVGPDTMCETFDLSCSCQFSHVVYSKICVKWPLSKRREIGFQDQLSLNAGQKYCRSAILLTFIMLAFDIKIFVLSIFELPFYTGFTVFHISVTYCT